MFQATWQLSFIISVLLFIYYSGVVKKRVREDSFPLQKPTACLFHYDRVYQWIRSLVQAFATQDEERQRILSG